MTALPRLLRPSLRLWQVVLLFLSFANSLGAHTLEFTQALVIVKADGTYQVDLTCDLDALALGAPPATDNALLLAELQAMEPSEVEALGQKLENYFARRIRVLVDGAAQRPTVSFPHFSTPLAAAGEPPAMFGAVARLEGRLPADATGIQLRASRSFPPLIIDYVHLGQRPGAPRLPVEPGAESSMLLLEGPTSASADDSGPRSWWQTVGAYLRIGFHHILPAGLDHVLFVLGLFLLDARLRPLLYQVTAFTLAHAVTLGLATVGYVNAPGHWVEPLIALSIVWVAVENLWWRRQRPAAASPTLPTWRLPLIFGLGLLHGLGFAGALGDVGLPTGQWLSALISFNIGIELGQLAVLLIAFAAVGWWRDRSWYGPRVVVPASLGIALVGLYWTVERLFL